MTYIGFHLDKETIDKLKIIALITKKNRSDLIREGIDVIIRNNNECFEQFQERIDKLRK